MRVEECIVIDASPEEIWERITDPDRYREFMHGVTRWEVEGRKKRGKGARYRLNMAVGSAQVGGLVEIVEFDEARDMAWTSVLGIDQRGRWRLRETGDGRTRVTLRLSYQSPSQILGFIADQVSAPTVRRNLRASLRQLAADLEGRRLRGAEMGEDAGVVKTVTQRLWSAQVLARAGFLRLHRPDQLARALTTLRRWGPTPAAGYKSAALLYPDEDAIIDELGHVTFKEVHERSNALANALADQGINEGDNVGLMMRNHRYFIEAVVALSKLGAHALLLNTAFAGPQLTDVVQREKPQALIFDQEFYGLLEDAGKRRKRFIAWEDDPGEVKDPTVESLIEGGDTADLIAPEEKGRVVILTSGTTGTPKGAERKQPDTVDPAAALLSKIPLRSREKWLIAAPLFHSWGFAHFTLGMLLSATQVLQRRFDPEQTLAGIAQHQAVSAPMVPVMVQRIMELPEETRRKYDTSSLRAVPLSGSALPGELAERFMAEFGDVVYNLYGSTEVAWATIATPADLHAAPGTAGRAPRGTIVRIYDEQGRELPPGETGRIFVGNEMLFEGYTGGGGKDVIDGLMSTGDVGHLDDSGRLFVEGRDDEMIVSGGENVFPAEVEDLLAKHDKIAEAAVIGVDDEKFGQRLKAFVVTRNGASISEDEVRDYVKSNLARYKVPRDVEFLDELPRNATGKVLKRELKDDGDGEGKDGSSRSRSASKASS
jgi:acyl-CoA synthetase (AMP-forming)/AMP-acid ligase II/ribosome-associated toxin RatA of RatAB toxin-antitoxin module